MAVADCLDFCIIFALFILVFFDAARSKILWNLVKSQHQNDLLVGYDGPSTKIWEFSLWNFSDLKSPYLSLRGQLEINVQIFTATFLRRAFKLMPIGLTYQKHQSIRGWDESINLKTRLSYPVVWKRNILLPENSRILSHWKSAKVMLIAITIKCSVAFG